MREKISTSLHLASFNGHFQFNKVIRLDSLGRSGRGLESVAVIFSPRGLNLPQKIFSIVLKG